MSIRNPLSHNVVHNQQCYTLTFLPTALAPTAVLYITYTNINTSPLPLNSLQNLHLSLLPTLPCLPLSTADPTVKTKSYDPASVLEAFKAALLAATALPTVNLHPEGEATTHNAFCGIPVCVVHVCCVVCVCVCVCVCLCVLYCDSFSIETHVFRSNKHCPPLPPLPPTSNTNNTNNNKQQTSWDQTPASWPR